MEITNTNWHFYVDDMELYRLAQSNGIEIDDMPYSMVASLAIPYEVYNLQQEKDRLEAINPPTDEYLIQWAKENCPESLNMREINKRIDEINELLTKIKP